LVVARAPPLVLCGQAQLPWTAISNFIFYLTVDSLTTKSRSLSIDAALLHDLDSIRTAWNTSIQGECIPFKELSLDSLLIATSQREAGDPRDHIFAVLGLLSERDKVLLPNYEEEVELMYQKAMVQALKSSNNFDLLFQANGPQQFDLPSWCLDFSVKNWARVTKEFVPYAFMRRSLYRETRLLPKSALKHDEKDGLLFIPGSIIGNILHFVKLTKISSEEEERHYAVSAKFKRSNPEPCPPFERSLLSCMLDREPLREIAYPALSRRLGPHKTRELLDSDLIWNVLAGGIPLRKHLNLDLEKLPPHLAQDYSEFGTWLKRYSTAAGAYNSQNCTEVYFKAMSQIFYAINFRAGGSTFFATDTGYIGNAADAVQENDIVCSLHGCSRLVVLRSYKDGSYRLITSAYVNDVMNYNEDKSIFVVETNDRETMEFRIR
jgi:hypothetical protein